VRLRRGVGDVRKCRVGKEAGTSETTAQERAAIQIQVDRFQQQYPKWFTAMPRELIALEPRKPVLREYEEPGLRLRQIRIRTEFASPKHGTEMVGYRNEPSARRSYDPEWAA